MDTHDHSTQLPPPKDDSEAITSTYVAVFLGIGVFVLIIIVAVMAVVVLRMLRRMRKMRMDGEERVTEGNDEPHDTFPQRTQHIQPSEAQNVRDPWRSRNAFENSALAHQENYALETEYNANQMQYGTITTARTPSPTHRAPRSSPNTTYDEECRQKQSLPLQNAPNGSWSSTSSSSQPVSVSDGTDRPTKTAVPIDSVTHDNPLYDRPRPNPVPVNGVTHDESIYQRPKNVPVPVNGATYDDSIYQRPQNTPVPVHGATYDESIYQSPKNTPVPVDGATYDESIYQNYQTTPVPVDDASYDDSIYQRPKNTPVPVNDDTQEHMYERFSELMMAEKGGAYDPLNARPCQDPLPVSDATHESLYERLSNLVGLQNNFTNSNDLYDHPNPTPVAVDNAKRDEGPLDNTLRPSHIPVPPPRPSKSAAVRKGQENYR